MMLYSSLNRYYTQDLESSEKSHNINQKNCSTMTGYFSWKDSRTLFTLLIKLSSIRYCAKRNKTVRSMDYIEKRKYLIFFEHVTYLVESRHFYSVSLLSRHTFSEAVFPKKYHWDNSIYIVEFEAT